LKKKKDEIVKEKRENRTTLFEKEPSWRTIQEAIEMMSNFGGGGEEVIRTHAMTNE